MIPDEEEPETVELRKPDLFAGVKALPPSQAELDYDRKVRAAREYDRTHDG